MITPEERESIINEAMERILKIIPETIGNMMVANASYQKLTKDFYEKYPEFTGHRDIVREVVNKVEGANPTKDFEDILKQSVPEIKKQLTLVEKLDSKIPRDSDLNLNGAI